MTDQREINAWSDPTVSRWLYLHPEARKLAPHVDAHLAQVERHQEAIRNRNSIAIRQDSERAIQMQAIRDELLLDGSTWSKRREAELALADYIETIPDPLRRTHDLDGVIEDLRNCRQSGAVGITPSGGKVIAWDNKCGMVRLCPDESREETQRLAERYLPAIDAWVKEKPTRRVFYAVLTQHNYRPGQLASGKRHQFELFKEFLDRKWKACPVDFKPVHGDWEVIRSRKRTMVPDSIAHIKGAFVVQEDPLAADGEWNVHLNVIFLVEGSFDYGEIREEWGANVHIRQVNPDDLMRSILEVVKYSAQIVPDKSERKRHETDAPAMTEYPHHLWLEWWKAQQGFRRTRSYGCMYGIPDPEPDEFDMDLVEWVGQIRFDFENGYQVAMGVDLIPGDNFSGRGFNPGTSHQSSDWWNTGPPH